MKQKIDRRLLRDINFLRFWGATVLSALGDSANYILLSWFIVDVTGSEGTLGTVLLCMSIQFITLFNTTYIFDIFRL